MDFYKLDGSGEWLHMMDERYSEGENSEDADDIPVVHVSSLVGSDDCVLAAALLEHEYGGAVMFDYHVCSVGERPSDAADIVIGDGPWSHDSAEGGRLVLTRGDGGEYENGVGQAVSSKLADIMYKDRDGGYYLAALHERLLDPVAVHALAQDVGRLRQDHPEAVLAATFDPMGFTKGYLPGWSVDESQEDRTARFKREVFTTLQILGEYMRNAEVWGRDMREVKETMGQVLDGAAESGRHAVIIPERKSPSGGRRTVPYYDEVEAYNDGRAPEDQIVAVGTREDDGGAGSGRYCVAIMDGAGKLPRYEYGPMEGLVEKYASDYYVYDTREHMEKAIADIEEECGLVKLLAEHSVVRPSYLCEGENMDKVIGLARKREAELDGELEATLGHAMNGRGQEAAAGWLGKAAEADEAHAVRATLEKLKSGMKAAEGGIRAMEARGEAASWFERAEDDVRRKREEKLAAPGGRDAGESCPRASRKDIGDDGTEI